MEASVAYVKIRTEFQWAAHMCMRKYERYLLALYLSITCIPFILWNLHMHTGNKNKPDWQMKGRGTWMVSVAWRILSFVRPLSTSMALRAVVTFCASAGVNISMENQHCSKINIVGKKKQKWINSLINFSWTVPCEKWAPLRPRRRWIVEKFRTELKKQNWNQNGTASMHTGNEIQVWNYSVLNFPTIHMQKGRARAHFLEPVFTR